MYAPRNIPNTVPPPLYQHYTPVSNDPPCDTDLHGVRGCVIMSITDWTCSLYMLLIGLCFYFYYGVYIDYMEQYNQFYMFLTTKFYLMYVWPCIIYENDERYRLDATIVIYFHKYLYMFRASICPSSGVQVVCCCIWCSAL